MIKLQDGGDRQVGQGLDSLSMKGVPTLRLRFEAVPKAAAPVTSPAQGGSNLVLAPGNQLRPRNEQAFRK